MLKDKLLNGISINFVVVAFMLLIIISLPLSTGLNGFGIILLSLSSILYIYRKKVDLQFNYIWLFAMPFVFDLIGLLYSSNVHHGTTFAVRRISIFLFPFIFSLYKIDTKLLKIFCYAFVILCTLLGFVSLLWAFYLQIEWSVRSGIWEINWFFFSYHDFVDIISLHAVYFSVYVGFCIVFLSVELFKGENLSYFYRKIIFYLLGFNFLIMFLLSARIPIVFTLVLFFGMLNYYTWKKSRLFSIGMNLLLVITIFITFSQLTILRERFLGIFGSPTQTEYIQKWDSSRGNISVRLQKWKGAALVVKENFFFGTGTGDAGAVLMEKYRDIGFDLGIVEGYNPHNQFLDTTSRTGIFSGIIFIVIFLIPMIRSIKNRNFLYFGFLALVFGVCLTESFLNSQKGIVFYSFFNSLLYNSTNNRKWM